MTGAWVSSGMVLSLLKLSRRGSTVCREIELFYVWGLAAKLATSMSHSGAWIWRTVKTPRNGTGFVFRW